MMPIRNASPFRIAVRKFAPFESAVQKIWDSYCLHSGCTQPVEMVPMELQPLHEALLEGNGLQNGDWDVAHLNTDWLYEAYTSGSLENLESYLQHSPPEDYPGGWSNSLLSMQQFGKAVAGLPFHDGPECLIYRKDLFEDTKEQESFLQQYGKPLQPPKTWDEFREVAQFFQRPTDNLYGTVFACYPDGHNTVFDFCLQLWTRGGDLLDENDQVNIHTPEAETGLNFYRNLVNDPAAVHPGSAGYDSVAAGMAFARGEAAMMINWFGFASMCEVIGESRVKGNVAITSLPSMPGMETASLNVYWLYVIGSGSRHKQLAYDFIRFAVNRQNDRLLTLEGGIGCRISTWNDEEVNRQIPYYHTLEALHRHARSLPQKKNWARIAEMIDEVVLRAVDTQDPVQDILREGQQKIRSIQKIAVH